MREPIRAWRNAGLVLGMLMLSSLLVCCGYLDSAFSPVDSSPTTLAGRVVDSLTHKPIPGATVSLRGVHEVAVTTDENGVFHFNETTTGQKELSISFLGYVPYFFTLDMQKSPNSVDTLLLRRVNKAPTIDKVYFPANSYTQNPKDLPLSIRFSWAFSDADFSAPYSSEEVRYLFRLRSGDTAVYADSGVLDISGMKRDSTLLSTNSFIAFRPDTLLKLSPNTLYHWRLVLRDRMGDSSVLPERSFTTRGSLPQCPMDSLDTMRLIEMEGASFCMDEHEVTNQEYAQVFYPSDPSQFLRPENLSQWSPATNTPVVFLSFAKAESLCVIRGKRLCTISEWKAALGGYERLNYPYGDVYDSAKCNTHWIMNEFTGQAFPVDSMTHCVSPFGIYDLSGNVAEWTVLDVASKVAYDPFDNQGNLLNYYAGGFWSSYSNSGINSVYYVPEGTRTYNIGFRCCKGF